MAKATTRSALQAAREVLRAQGVPLHCREIARRILESGLWESHGKTPEATIHARLASDIKMNGEQLVALLVENELGVRRTPLQLIELGEGLSSQQDDN